MTNTRPISFSGRTLPRGVILAFLEQSKIIRLLVCVRNIYRNYVSLTGSTLNILRHLPYLLVVNLEPYHAHILCVPKQ